MQNVETPREALETRDTATDEFFVREHFERPPIDRARHRINVTGLVTTPREFSVAMLQELPQRSVECVLECSNGVLASVHLDFVQQPPQHTLTVIGTAGTITWDQSSGAARLHRPDGRVEVADVTPSFDRNDMFLAEMKTLLDVVDGTATAEPSLADGVHVMDIVFAVRESDRTGRRVLLRGGGEVAYDRLLLATGARPRQLPSDPGGAALTLRTLDHADAIDARARSSAAAVIVGAGLIGLELAAELRRRGLAVTVLEAGPRVLGRGVPAEIAGVIAARLPILRTPTSNCPSTRSPRNASAARPGTSRRVRIASSWARGSAFSAGETLAAEPRRPQLAASEPAGRARER